MAVGLRPKFDFRLVASAMASQTLNGELGLNEAHTPLESASQTAVNSAVAAIAYGQTPDIEMLAAQALGTMIGYSVGNPLASQGQFSHPSSRDNQQPMQQAKPAKRSSTLFDKEQVKACASDEPLSSKPKAERDPVRQASERVKRWQEQKQPSYADKRFITANLDEIVSHTQFVSLPQEGVEAVYPEFWLQGAIGAIKFGAIGLKFGVELLEPGLSRIALMGRQAITSINPNEIRYSQETVSYLKNRFGKSYTFDEIVQSMKVEGWKGVAIDIVKMPEGGLSTLDNTRVLAAKKAGIDVLARVRRYNERLPQEMLTRFRHLTVSDSFAETWGEALEYRIMKQKLDFMNKNFPVGTYENPTINYPKTLPIFEY